MSEQKQAQQEWLDFEEDRLRKLDDDLFFADQFGSLNERVCIAIGRACENGHAIARVSKELDGINRKWDTLDGK